MEKKETTPKKADALVYETNKGEFGEYLSNPLDAKERLAIVARNMAICRREAGMSQRDVCTVIGCAPQTYSGYEKGKHEPTMETLVRLSHLYHVSLDFLIGKYDHEDNGRALEEEFVNLHENPWFFELETRIAILEQKLDKL